MAEIPQKKETKINWTFLIVIGVLAISIIIILLRASSQTNNLPSWVDDSMVKCISQSNLLFKTLVCSHCKEQEQILGKYYNSFNKVDCIDNAEICSQNNVTGVPTWIINGQHYIGVKSWDELKNITGC